MKDELTEAVFAAGWGAVRRMPAPAARGMFKLMADQAWLRHGDSVQQLEKNLRRVVPDASARELRELSRESMRSYLRYWNEVFRLPDLSPEEIVSSVRPQGVEHMIAAMEAGKGAVLATPHMGNWDHAAAWVTLEHYSFTTVVERLKPEGLYERFLDFRRSLGMEILPLTGGESPFRALLDRARAGGMVVLVGDRDLSQTGLPVTFFGEEARMPRGPAALSLATGAPLLPATIWYDGTYTGLRINEPIVAPEDLSKADKILHLTQQMADVFEAGIAEHPADWHMLQPLWTADLDPRRLPSMEPA